MPLLDLISLQHSHLAFFVSLYLPSSSLACQTELSPCGYSFSSLAVTNDGITFKSPLARSLESVCCMSQQHALNDCHNFSVTGQLTLLLTKQGT